MNPGTKRFYELSDAEKDEVYASAKRRNTGTPGIILESQIEEVVITDVLQIEPIFREKGLTSKDLEIGALYRLSKAGPIMKVRKNGTGKRGARVCKNVFKTGCLKFAQNHKDQLCAHCFNNAN